MITLLTIAISVLLTAGAPDSGKAGLPVWPPAPDDPKIAYIGEIDCAELTFESGLFAKLKRFVGGRSPEENLSMPFDLLVKDGYLYMTCQNLAGLVEINLSDNTFKIHNNEKSSFEYPIALCDGGGGTIFITDSERKTVFRYTDGKIEPFISTGLVRPTGIACDLNSRQLYVVDTGDHSLKIYDFAGMLISKVGGQRGLEGGFNFPTFAASAHDSLIIINDALNYRIKLFNTDGDLISSFGEEGDGPGTFSRPKGIDVDSDGHIYVVDNLFDNLQVFDPDGRLLLVIGSAGQEIGQFWSPSGIDIENDTIYIADTFNNRIQILRYLGGSDE